MNESLQFFLTECHGVFNYYFPDDNKDLKKSVNKLYNYIRSRIIDKFNNRVQGAGNIISFKLDSRYRLLGDVKLKDITINYHGSVYKNGIKIEVKESLEDKNKLLLNIYIDLFDTLFKVHLIHEIKHYIQLSTNSYVFKDYYKILKLLDLEDDAEVVEDIHNANVNRLISVVDKLNLQEAEAYLEQVYDIAFWRRINERESIDDILKHILKDYKVDNDTWYDEIIRYKDDSVIQDYIIKLLIINFSEFVGNKHKYLLFGKDVINNRTINRLRQYVKNITGNDASTIDGEVIDYCAEEISKDIDLKENIINNFFRRLNNYRIKFNNKVGTVCYDACQDAIIYNNNSYARLNVPSYLNYSRKENGKLYVEITLLEDDEIVYISELCGKNLEEIFRKFSALKYRAISEYSVDFGYSYIFEKAYTQKQYYGKYEDVPDMNNLESIDDFIEDVEIINSVSL